MPVKKILLTGSTSFLGSKFIELYKDAYDILGISKSDPTNPIDLLDLKSLKSAVETFSPDVIIHTAAIVDQDAEKVRIPNIQSTKNIVEVAKINNNPIIFSSSESVYGGKENEGNYSESDSYKPRSIYGETKVESEKIIIESGLNFLITRAHRYVGINNNYHKPKQFPDTLKKLIAGEKVILDDHKLFRPCLINNIAYIYAHYIENDLNKKIIFNLGVDKTTTYFDFIVDVARSLDLDSKLIEAGGNELTWPENSSLSINKLKSSKYPSVSYSDLLGVIRQDYLSIKF
jgi:dTDP-4-dehydrorhamnose reductase